MPWGKSIFLILLEFLYSLETMACGTPVITSNTSSFPEVLGDASVMIDPHLTEELIEGMRRVLSDEDLFTELKKRGSRGRLFFPGRRQ
jgi:glycosyltransferase involved in cell wall biosynthesis